MSLKEFLLIRKLGSYFVSMEIGEGAYSTVYRVKRIVDGQDYALKMVKLTNLNEKEKTNALNEVRILASIHHANIISYKDSFIDGNNLWYCLRQLDLLVS
jgi:NIMA (never in mitosis gene a)-related kinase